MAWKIDKITIDMVEDKTNQKQQKVLQGNDLTNGYIGLGWGKLTGGNHQGKHVFDESIYSAAKSTASAAAIRLKEPNCGVKDLP